MGRPRRISISLTAACCLAAGALWAASASAEPVGQVERFPTGCAVGPLLAGPDGNVWFGCFKYRPISGGQGEVGRITPQGQVTEFSAGIPGNAEPTDVVVGPDGNIWFTLLPGANLLPRETPAAAIGRLTPDGQITLFSAGLGSAPGSLTVAPDGNLWFIDHVGSGPAVGRITPQGAITEFPTGFPTGKVLGALAVGPDGNLWSTEAFALPRLNGDPPISLIARIAPSGAITEFGSVADTGRGFPGAAVAGRDGNVWFVGANPKQAIDRIDPSGQITEFRAGLSSEPSELGSMVAGPDGNLWFTAQRAIGRIAPDGTITEFDECLRYRQLFSGPESLTAGPDGNVWFTSVTSRSLPSIAEPPTIGRITPSGQITQFRAGLGSEPRSIVAGPDGRVWFSGGADQIERITPPSAPVNTFLVGLAKAKANGLAAVPVEVPGPGALALQPVALVLRHKRTVRLPGTRTVTAAAAACGSTLVPLRLKGAARTRLRHRGSIELRVRATFTPTGGSANTKETTIPVRVRRHRS
jgi:virginiamycin B lyase